MSSDRRNLLGVFAHLDALVAALRRLSERDIPIAEVYSPVQSEEVIAAVEAGRSPVRIVTLAGAISGLAAGFALALLTSAVWELVVDGKPVYAIVPFVVVGFELTILLGALFTLVGLLVFARLPFRRFPSLGYRPAFSDDRFGIWVACPPARLDETRELFTGAGALEIEDLDSTAARGDR